MCSLRTFTNQNRFFLQTIQATEYCPENNEARETTNLQNKF